MHSIVRCAVVFFILAPSILDAACIGSSPTWTSTPDSTSVASCVSQATRESIT